MSSNAPPVSLAGTYTGLALAALAGVLTVAIGGHDAAQVIIPLMLPITLVLGVLGALADIWRHGRKVERALRRQREGQWD